MILKVTAIKEKGFTDFTLNTQNSNSIFESFKEKQKIPSKKKDDYDRKRKKELERELQTQMKALIKEVYEQAHKLNIEMPAYPDPPYTDKQFEYFINYFQQEFGDKIIDAIEYVENEKKRRKKEEEKNTKEIMNIVFDLSDKIYYSAESDFPIQALQELEEDFYYKRNMEYLKEITNEHYRFVLREYMHVLRLMEKKKPVIKFINEENDFETLCKNFCSINK